MDDQLSESAHQEERDWKQDYLLLADAVGKREAAQRYLDAFHTDAAALGAALATKPTISLTSIAPDRVRIFGISSFAGSIVADTGLPRPAGQRFDDTSADLSLETIDRANGEWIFVGVQGDNPSITGSAIWKALPAVASGQVPRVDYDVWYLNAGPAAASIVLSDLTDTLHK